MFKKKYSPEYTDLNTCRNDSMTHFQPECEQPPLIVQSCCEYCQGQEAYEIEEPVELRRGPFVNQDGFQVAIEVKPFKRDELTVRVVDHYIVIEGVHEEREEDYGLVARHFTKKFQLPQQFDPKDVVSSLSVDGILTVRAPHPPGAAEKWQEHDVHIQLEADNDPAEDETREESK